MAELNGSICLSEIGAGKGMWLERRASPLFSHHWEKEPEKRRWKVADLTRDLIASGSLWKGTARWPGSDTASCGFFKRHGWPCRQWATQVGMERSVLSYGVLCLDYSLWVAASRALHCGGQLCSWGSRPTQSRWGLWAPRTAVSTATGRSQSRVLEEKPTSRRAVESGAGVRTLVMAIGRNRYTEEQRLGDTVQTARGAVSKVCCVKCTSCIKNIKFRNWVWWHIPIIPALGFGQKNQKFKDTTETCLTNK